MRRRILAVVLCLALLASVLPAVVSTAPALAAASTSVHVVKYYADGTTVMNETTVNYSWMEANLPVQGNGTTRYWSQGPTFNASNVWDPDETLNLRDKGVLKGTDVKDLCSLVGNASSGDTIKIQANDGFSKTVDYENVYTPQPRQGKMVLCWWKDGSYVPSYADGLRLVFFAETTNANGSYVFGNWDMHECLPESRWHWYDPTYPSADGYSVKYIDHVIIYTDEPAPTPTVSPTVSPTASPTPTATTTDVPTSTPTESPTLTPTPTATPWTLFLNGSTTYNMPQSEFENGVSCHGAVTFNNSDGTWSGMPLWLLCGWVDDGTQHGSGAFNDSLAASGYTVKVIASDNYNRSFSSQVVARNDSMIIANLLNSNPLPSNRYPLRLVGTGLSSGQMVSKIAEIQLIFPTPTPTVSPTPTETVPSTPTESPTPTTSPTATASPTPTPTIHIVKYAADGITILEETTVNLSWMESNLPVQGNGTTHYWLQGPTLNESNKWDPDETLNLKDKGALKGTDVKDLCDLVGNASSGDTIKIKATDGYNEVFQYDDVYNPEPEQGKFVACWWKDGDYGGPSYPEAFQLVFFAETTNANGSYVFGNWDMHEYLPEDNWHYWWDGSIQYPVSNGLSIKYIDEISIYTNPTPGWNLSLVGVSTYNMSQTEFENGVACHGAATWNDSVNTWSGMPLWLLCGWVDDGVVHGPNAFNDSLAAAGYTVKVIASDGYNRSFSSQIVANNNSMIIANEMNDAPLNSSYYPLRLVGNGLSSGQRVSKIAEIQLIFPTPTPTPSPTPTMSPTATVTESPTPTVSPTTTETVPPTPTESPTPTVTASPTPTVSPTPTASPTATPWVLFLNGSTTYNMSQAEFENGVSCHGAVTFNNSDGTWSGMPLWLLCGWVDDGAQHGSGAFNDSLAAAGYTVKVIASDNYNRSFSSQVVARNDSMIIANLLNGSPLPSNRYPLRLVGTGLSSGQMVSKIVQIQLLFPTPTPTPTISPTSTVTPTASPTPTPTATPGPGDLNGDYVINCCDITQCELCILDPVKYPKSNYPGWDANEDGEGPNAGDILGVELRILGLWH